MAISVHMLGLRLMIEAYTALEERRAHPEHDRYGQESLKPEMQPRPEPAVERYAQMHPHLEDEDRERQKVRRSGGDA